MREVVLDAMDPALEGSRSETPRRARASIDCRLAWLRTPVEDQR